MTDPSRGTRVTTPLPDFICIGAQKAGTTWLHRQLSGHPEIFLPPGKELDYFFSDRSPSWYKAQFSDAAAGQLTGDISPNYMPRESIPARMAELAPAARLICLLRDPADRAFSQWKMARDRGNIPRSQSFSDAFANDARFIRTRGHYGMLIRRYERLFPLGIQFRVFFFDDIVARPYELLKEIFAYLGVDQDYRPAGVNEVVHGAKSPERLDENTRKTIIEHYRDDIDEIERRFDRDLGTWKR